MIGSVGDRPRLTLALALSAAALSSALVATPARALPLYASREGAKCGSCHFDPNGGGMRKDFGFNYAKNRHSMEEEDRWNLGSLDPQLNDWIRLGMDTRVMYVASHFQGDESTLSSSTFFPMQGNLRVAITPHDNLAIVGSHGIVVDVPGFPAPYVARELYGYIHGLPYDAFIQVGRFRVPFGLRQDDHTSFVRSEPFLPYDSQKEDAGIAVGSVGKNGWFEFSFTNGSTPFDERAQALAGKVAWSFPWLQGGVSGYHRYSEMLDARYDRWSLYLSRTFRQLTLIGEAAGATDEFPLVTINRAAAFAELDYRLARGVNLRGKVDWFDSNRGPGGAIDRRYLGEVDINPVPFVEVKGSFRHYDFEGPGAMNEYIAMLFMPF